MPFRPRWRHVLWIFAAFLVLKIYMVQEILAAFLVFAAVFATITILILATWIVQFVGERMLVWSETWLRGLRVAGARGALVFAELTRRVPRGTTAP